MNLIIVNFFHHITNKQLDNMFSLGIRDLKKIKNISDYPLESWFYNT